MSNGKNIEMLSSGMEWWKFLSDWYSSTSWSNRKYCSVNGGNKNLNIA